MNRYECKRCGYKGNQKQDLRKHLSKKKICNAVIEDISREELLKQLDTKEVKRFICIKCDKELSSKYNKLRHESICDYEPELKLDNPEIIELRSMVNKLMLENKEMRERLEELTPNTTNNTINNTTNNTTNNTNNNMINIIIENLNPFGKENYDYVDEVFLKKLLKKDRLMLFDFIKLIHFNINHPENWNYFISNKGKNEAHVFTGKKYEIKNKKETINLLIEAKQRKLLRLVQDLEDLLEEEKDEAIEIINRYNGGEDYKSSTEKLKAQTEEFAYNKREKIEQVSKCVDKNNKNVLNEELKLK